MSNYKCPQCGSLHGTKLLKEVSLCNKCFIKENEKNRGQYGFLTSKDLGVVDDPNQFQDVPGHPDWKLLVYPGVSKPPDGWRSASWTDAHDINKPQKFYTKMHWQYTHSNSSGVYKLSDRTIGGPIHILNGTTIKSALYEYGIIYSFKEEK